MEKIYFMNQKLMNEKLIIYLMNSKDMIYIYIYRKLWSNQSNRLSFFQTKFLKVLP